MKRSDPFCARKNLPADLVIAVKISWKEFFKNIAAPFLAPINSFLTVVVCLPVRDNLLRAYFPVISPKINYEDIDR